MTQFASIKKDDSVTIMLNGKLYEIFEDNKNYENIIKAINNRDYEELETLVNIKIAVAKYSNGLIEIVDNKVHYKGKLVHNYVATKLIKLWKSGIDVAPLSKFIERLMNNPSYRAVNELYGFMEKHNLPITEDGYFLAYKKVGSDFTDIHTGTFNNSVGQVVEMARNEVNEDKDMTCSYGLHFCGFDYLKHFGSNVSGQYNVVILKIDPADVVAIPTDYNNAKGRCCKYEVIGLHSTGVYEPSLTSEVHVMGHIDSDICHDDWDDGGSWDSWDDYRVQD